MDNLHIMKSFLFALDKQETQVTFHFPDTIVTTITDLVQHYSPLLKYKVFSFAKDICPCSFPEDKLETCATFLERYYIGRSLDSFGFLDVLDFGFQQTLNILRAHPLPDGNKRLSFYTGIYFSYFLIGKEDNIILTEQEQILLASAGYQYLNVPRVQGVSEFQITWNSIIGSALIREANK